VIGIAGTRADPVLLHFATRCVVAGVPFADLDLMEAAMRGDWDLSLPPDPQDRICGAEDVRLADLSGIYVRPIFLGTTDRQRMRWSGLLEGLSAWLDETGTTVVNRPGGYQFNSYKPAHLRLAGGTRAGRATQPDELRPGPDRSLSRRRANGGQAGLRSPGHDP
jgi:hypothetical protein